MDEHVTFLAKSVTFCNMKAHSKNFARLSTPRGTLGNKKRRGDSCHSGDSIFNSATALLQLRHVFFWILIEALLAIGTAEGDRLTLVDDRQLRVHVLTTDGALG